MFYKQLYADKFEAGPTGTLINSTEVIVPVKSGTTKYKLREKSAVERNFVRGIWVNAPESTAQNADETYTVINRTSFNSSYLTLRENTTDIYEKISLLHIEKCNTDGKPYYIELGKWINLSESTLHCHSNAGIGADEAFSLRFDYSIPK